MIYLWAQPFRPLYDWDATDDDEDDEEDDNEEGDDSGRRPCGVLLLHELLHIRNYWRYHFTSTQEDTYSRLYGQLVSNRSKMSCPLNPLTWFSIASDWVGAPGKTFDHSTILQRQITPFHRQARNLTSARTQPMISPLKSQPCISRALASVPPGIRPCSIYVQPWLSMTA